MHLNISPILVSLFAVLAAAVPNRPRTFFTPPGTIVKPTTGTVVTSGESLPFSYQNRNWCEAVHSPISIWLLDFQPTDGNLNMTGQFPDATITHFFGAYDIGNFGDPALGPLPPATLIIPDVSGFPVGSDLYLAVVETSPAGSCPTGSFPAEYGLTSTLLVTSEL
ncbi:hypothetical protein B0H19DRAFT_1118336 [Mycena capillaripes]|nr:hypothetical protein B0H19DRAFT_1118336 [Mycena capillaripes]